MKRRSTCRGSGHRQLLRYPRKSIAETWRSRALWLRRQRFVGDVQAS